MWIPTSLHSWVVECSSYAGRHAGEGIKAEPDNRIEAVELPGSCEVLAVNDNAANVVLATGLSTVIHKDLRCCCHSLELAIKDAFKEVNGMEAAVQKCKKVAGHVHHSSIAQQDLEIEC